MSKTNGTKHHNKPLASPGVVFPALIGPTEGLRAFADNVYNGIIIQESAAVVRTSIREYMSDDFKSTINGLTLTADEWIDAFMENRKNLKDLYVTEKRVTVVPADTEGLTGYVSHFARVEGNEKGVGKIVADCVFNYIVGSTEDRKRQVEDVNSVCGQVLVEEDS